MGSYILLVLFLVALPNVQLGHSQCDVVRIAAAVHETLGLTLEGMKESIKAIGFHTCGGTAGWRRAVYL
ncbi:hypothetical protein GBAR_LOCUS22708, partial [Geodia barretti]